MSIGKTRRMLLRRLEKAPELIGTLEFRWKIFIAGCSPKMIRHYFSTGKQVGSLRH